MIPLCPRCGEGPCKKAGHGKRKYSPPAELYVCHKGHWYVGNPAPPRLKLCLPAPPHANQFGTSGLHGSSRQNNPRCPLCRHLTRRNGHNLNGARAKAHPHWKRVARFECTACRRMFRADAIDSPRRTTEELARRAYYALRWWDAENASNAGGEATGRASHVRSDCFRQCVERCRSVGLFRARPQHEIHTLAGLVVV
jgi:hypothetical protein